MKTLWPLVVACVCFQLGLFAQQLPVGTEAVSSAEEVEGRRIFQQKCAVCHLPIVTSGGEPYARRLSSALIRDNEEYARQAIANGSGPLMPGWKYTLRPDQIDALIAYLKTLDSPGPTVASRLPEP